MRRNLYRNLQIHRLLVFDRRHRKCSCLIARQNLICARSCLLHGATRFAVFEVLVDDFEVVVGVLEDVVDNLEEVLGDPEDVVDDLDLHFLRPVAECTLASMLLQVP